MLPRPSTLATPSRGPKPGRGCQKVTFDRESKGSRPRVKREAKRVKTGVFGRKGGLRGAIMGSWEAWEAFGAREALKVLARLLTPGRSKAGIPENPGLVQPCFL